MKDLINEAYWYVPIIVYWVAVVIALILIAKHL